MYIYVVIPAYHSRRLCLATGDGCHILHKNIRSDFEQNVKELSCFNLIINIKFFLCDDRPCSPSRYTYTYYQYTWRLKDVTKTLTDTLQPESIRNSVKRSVTPVLRTPSQSALCTGAAPRYFGSKDGWMLTVPLFGISRNRWGKNCKGHLVIHLTTMHQPCASQARHTRIFFLSLFWGQSELL